jgi:type I restriction enzyme M protein
MVKLNRRRLFEIAKAVGTDLPPNTRKKDLLQTFEGLSFQSFGVVLEQLTTVELRQLCRVAGLDDSGREERLRDRLSGREQTITAAISETLVVVSPDSLLPMQQAPKPEGQLSQEELESHLWEAANILRGTVDSSDYRLYIVSLLFYKRISDVWEESQERVLLTTHGLGSSREVRTPYPEEHRFQIPRKHLWKAVCGVREGLGIHLKAAFNAIEEANPRFKGLLRDVDFAHRERFPDTTLERLVRHFERVRLRHSDVSEDMLGNAYLFLIAQFANDAGKKGGEFYTPKMVVRLLVECLDPKKGQSICDPACGSGGMLLEALEHVQRYYPEDPRSLRLFGQERNLNTWVICQMNFLLHGIDDAWVAKGDTLLSPQHLDDGGRLMQFDRVLANPPFSLKPWGHEDWSEGDPYGRDLYGCPPKRYGDLAFVQHMLASLKPDGMLGVVLPHGVLFRGKSEGRIRRGLLEDDLLEAVIGLPANLFYGTGIPACIWILNGAKDEQRCGKVLFVDGSQEMEQGKNRNYLSEANVARLRQTFKNYSDEEGFSRVVTLKEILARSFNLHIPLYVAPPLEETRVDIPATLVAMHDLEQKARALEDEIEAQVRELGY